MNNLKQEIRKYMGDHNLVHPKYNAKCSRKDVWDKINLEYSKFIFSNYEEYNSRFPIKIRDFIEHFFYDKEIEFYETFEDFFVKSKPTRLTTILLSKKATPLFEYVSKNIGEIKKSVDFEPKSIQELKYCYVNGLKSRPLCKECTNPVEFGKCFNYGFRDYCSRKCQMDHNNKVKEISRTNLSDDEIRSGIEKIPLDNRNTTKEFIAANFLRIDEFSSQVNPAARDKEKIYIFHHNLNFDSIKCPHCSAPRQFISQGRGYRKTCGKSLCKFMERSDPRVSEKGHLYIFYSPSQKFYKIGITNDIKRRFVEIKKTLSDLEIIDTFYFKENLQLVEQKIHQEYRDHRIIFEERFNGYTELFELDDEKLNECIAFIKKVKELKEGL